MSCLIFQKGHQLSDQYVQNPIGSPRVTDDSVKMKGNIWWEYATKEPNILVTAGISFWMDENDRNVLGQRRLTC